MEIYVVKNVLNVVSLVKIGHFWENVKNCVILGAKMTSYVKVLGKGSNTFSLKVSKNYLSQVFAHIFRQKWH